MGGGGRKTEDGGQKTEVRVREAGIGRRKSDGKLGWLRKGSDKSRRCRHSGGIQSGTGDLLKTKHETGRRRMNTAIHSPRKESVSEPPFPWSDDRQRIGSGLVQI